MQRTEIWDRIVAERQKQREKFGNEPIADVDGLIRIAGEEFGEVCRCINQDYDTKISRFQKEIIQLVAVCVAYLENDLHDGRKP